MGSVKDEAGGESAGALEFEKGGGDRPAQPGSPAPARAGALTARRRVSEFCQIIQSRVRSPPPDATMVAVSDPLTFSRARVRILSFLRATIELLRQADCRIGTSDGETSLRRGQSSSSTGAFEALVLLSALSATAGVQPNSGVPYRAASPSTPTRCSPTTY